MCLGSNNILDSHVPETFDRPYGLKSYPFVGINTPFRKELVIFKGLKALS